MRFPLERGESYLTTELADALVDAGHEVEVVQLDWDAPSGGASERLASARGIPVLRVCPRAIGRPRSLAWRASKFVLSARHVGREVRRLMPLAEFDAIVAWMPAIAFAPVVRRAARAGVERRILFVWDFFPDHHAEIGRLPRGPARWLARRWEGSLLRTFTTIFCTLPANCDYLRQRFRLAPGQQVRVAPVWMKLEAAPPVDRARVRARRSLPAEAPIAVFGGQMTAGRGLGQILEAAALAHRQGSPLAFLFVGDGPRAKSLAELASASPNVFYLPAMSVADYRELLGACDVGMVATVPGVTSHSMPSKTLDYLKAGLPVVAAVEPGSEFAGLIEQRDVGRALPFGDTGAFLYAAAFLAADPRFRDGLRARTYSCLADVFDVRLTVSAILEAAGERRETNSSATKPAANAAWVAK
jgi:glycosyltransferase involved in cell wall biosynthesis